MYVFLYYLACQLLCGPSTQKEYCLAHVYPSLVCTDSKRMVGGVPIVSREVLMSAANCLQLYVFLVFLSPASTKKRPHTLHRSSTFFACISILKIL